MASAAPSNRTSIIGIDHSSAPHSIALSILMLRVVSPVPNEATIMSFGDISGSMTSASEIAQAVGLLATTPPSINGIFDCLIFMI